MDQGNKNNEKIDLSGAFKNFGIGVKSNEYETPRSYYSDTPKIIQLTIKYSGGFVKDEKQANYVLIGFVIIAIIVSLFLVFKSSSKVSPPFGGGSNPDFNPNLPEK